MALDLDKNYKIIELDNNQIISGNEFTTICSISAQKGYLDCIVFKISDTDMKLIIEIDEVNVVNEFTLKDFASIYGLTTNIGFSLPLASIDSKTFKYQPRDYQQFDTGIVIKLKHNSKNNKKLEAGYITYQER